MATPIKQMFSQSACFRLLLLVEENFSRIVSRFSSANLNIKVHSAEEKFGFRDRLLSIFVFTDAEKSGLLRLEVSLSTDS